VFAPGSRVCRRSLACACGQGCADRALAGLATAQHAGPHQPHRVTNLMAEYS